MSRQKTYSHSHFVFSKWTRKSYAVFNSLKREVSIAQLGFDLRSFVVKIQTALNFILEINMNDILLMLNTKDTIQQSLESYDVKEIECFINQKYKLIRYY